MYVRWVQHLYTRSAGPKAAPKLGNASAKDAKEAGKVLEAARKKLKAKDAATVAVKAACLEFDHGSEERGRTVFEEILGRHPKRLDIWAVYADQQAKALRRLRSKGGRGEESALRRCRDTFERMCSQKLKQKKMRSALERYLRFEQDLGDEEGQDRVREIATEYAGL